MKNIVIICPMKEELQELINKAGEYSKKSYGIISGYEFTTKRGLVFAFEGKIGKVNIGFDIGYLAALLKIDILVTLGVAGALTTDILPLNVVVADKVCYYDVDLTSTEHYVLGQMAGEELYYQCSKESLDILSNLNTTLTVKVGTVISGDSFATKESMSKELLSHFDHPLAVDMESGAVGQVCHRLNIPFVVIRGISDTINEDMKAQQVEFDEFLSLSARRAASILLHLLNEETIGE